MTEAWHYPQDLFDILVDAIPRLCRSKKDVFLFFRGAGVPAQYYADLERQVGRDKDSITKFAIVRQVLQRLNDATSNPALKARRDRVLRTRMHEVLEVLISWFRDLIVVHADPNSAQVTNRDRLDDLRRLAPDYQVEMCRRVCAYLEDTKQQLRQNVNLRLTAEVVALRLITASTKAA